MASDSETDSSYVEDLGRKRPRRFHSRASELGFCFSVMSSQIMAEYFISGFNVIVPSLTSSLDISESASVWPASAFALTTGASLLIFGRLADIYGGYAVYTCGLAWYLVWSIIAGFSQNELMLIFARALQGFGPAAFLSSGIMLLGSTYRPGPRKNLVFSIYGACAPIGFFVGIFMSGLCAQYLDWRWYFFIGAILVAMSLAAAVLFMRPSREQPGKTSKKKVGMDWPGAVLFFTGLILLFFAVNEGAHAPKGWATSYVWICCVMGCLTLAAAAYVEGWQAKEPLLPPSLFKVPHMTVFIIALFFSYGVLGAWLLYSTFYMTNIMGAEPLQLVAWYAPFAAGGLILSTTGGLLLHRIPGKLLLCISGASWVVSSVLFAVAPKGANYWAYIFPAMIGGTLGIDITYNIANIFVTTKLPEEQQGLAGAICNSTVFLGISFFLGFADLVAKQTEEKGKRESYKAVFWFVTAVAAIALFLMVGFVKMGAAKSEVREQDKETRSDEEPPMSV